MENVWLAFFAGLTSGGVSCLAVQGGLLASAVSDEQEKYKDTLYFLLSKATIYTILGALLGGIGSAFSLSIKAQGVLQILIGIFMIATAGRILNLHPIFRYTVIQPPTFILRKLKAVSNGKNIFTPIFLGALTVLIPCGVTQAMLILALGTGSYLYGGLIMLAFVLGTSPVFFALGLTVSGLFKHAILSKVAAAVIVLIGLISINNGQVLRGSVHTFQNYTAVLFQNKEGGQASLTNGYQEVEITASNRGYASNVKSLKAGVPVRLKVTTQNTQSCARDFAIPSLGINKLLPITGTEIIEFTPQKSGILTYSCGMGMYTGSFKITQ